MNWELYAWTKRGSRRKKALKLLVNSQSPLTTNEIKKKLKVALSQASFTIKELSNKKLVECLNPKDKIGRLYKSTTEGKDLMGQFQVKV